MPPALSSVWVLSLNLGVGGEGGRRTGWGAAVPVSRAEVSGAASTEGKRGRGGGEFGVGERSGGGWGLNYLGVQRSGIGESRRR